MRGNRTRHHHRRAVLAGLSAALALTACAQEEPPAPIVRKAPLPPPEPIPADVAVELDFEALAEMTQADVDAIREAHFRIRTEGQARRFLPHVEIWVERAFTYRIVAEMRHEDRLQAETVTPVLDLPHLKNDLLFVTLHEVIDDLWTRYGNMEGEWPRLLDALTLRDRTLLDRRMAELGAARRAAGGG